MALAPLDMGCIWLLHNTPDYLLYKSSIGLLTPLPPLEDMGVDHRGLDIGMAREFLDRLGESIPHRLLSQ